MPHKIQTSLIVFEYTSEHFSSKPDIPQGSKTFKNFVPLFQSLDLQHGTNADKRFIASFICIAYLIMLGPISEQVVALWWPLELEFCKMTLF